MKGRRRWERASPKKVRRRRVERAVLGAGMGVAAWAIERRIVKGLRRKGLDDEFKGRGRTDAGFDAATAERARDEP